MKKTTLIIARHGNTFEDGETPRRVGFRTDLHLTEKGRAQARAIGRWLKDTHKKPEAIFCSYLRRVMETAVLAMIESGAALHIQKEGLFNEIDYGPDENKTEDEVIARIGAEAIGEWDKHGIAPPGWDVDPQAIIKGWLAFGNRVVTSYPGCTVLAVTSNGIARFAPHLTGDFEGFRAAHKIKISTGALCVLEHDGAGWTVTDWNLKP